MDVQESSHRLFVESLYEAESHPKARGKEKQELAVASFKAKLGAQGVPTQILSNPDFDAALRKNVDDVIHVNNACKTRIDNVLKKLGVA